ncbi:hypothetical protein L6R29_03455 [Myxococcota bacterium]|nr:hypothetical protein [Myxococcota bacterium]
MIDKKFLGTYSVRILQTVAQRLDIAGRTRMSKRSLIEAILETLQQQPLRATEITSWLSASPPTETSPSPVHPVPTPPAMALPTTLSSVPNPPARVLPTALPTKPQPTEPTEPTKPSDSAIWSKSLPTSPIDGPSNTESFSSSIQSLSFTETADIRLTQSPVTPSATEADQTFSLPPTDWTLEALESQNSRQLQQIARTLDIAGRTRMSKRSLIQAILDFFLARKPTPPKATALPSHNEPAQPAKSRKADPLNHTTTTPATAPMSTEVSSQTASQIALSTELSLDQDRGPLNATNPPSETIPTASRPNETTATASTTSNVSPSTATASTTSSANEATTTASTTSSTNETTTTASTTSSTQERASAATATTTLSTETGTSAPTLLETETTDATLNTADDRQAADGSETIEIQNDTEDRVWQDEDDYAALVAAEKARAEKNAQTIELPPIPRDSVLQPDLDEVHAAIEPPPPHPPRTSATPYIDRGPTLPARYENTRIRAMIRDPQSVYVYWNTPEPPQSPWKIEARDEGGDIVHTFQVPPQYHSGYVRAQVSQIRMIAAHIQPPARTWFPIASIDLKIPPRRLSLEIPPSTSTAATPPSTQATESWVRWDTEQAQAHPAPTPAVYDVPAAISTHIPEPPAPSVASHTPSEHSDSSSQQAPASLSPTPPHRHAPTSADLQRTPPWKAHPPIFPPRTFPPHGGAPSSASLIRPLPSSASLVHRAPSSAAFRHRTQ